MSPQGITKSKSGLPLLTNDQIDQLAEECALNFFPEMFEKPQPIDPVEFIETGLGFDVDYLYLSNCQLYLGMTAFKNIAIPVFDMERFCATKANVDAGTVIIDRGLYDKTEYSGNEGRLRFTEAHEAGHCLLHGDFFLNAANRTKETEQNFIIGACHSAFLTEEDLAEHQADQFASCFLIPLTPLKKLLESHHAWNWEDKHKLLLVKETFNVSWPTAFYRLKKLGFLETQSTTYNWDEFSGY
ncbi:ImmA/IrrE family metallo-endopeptidase [Ileibacterium valens]|uniref:ImmA/IrrE family metallo-endopeptidase n=1 Tax=Ileibacterium valens TaxID=1862668 RepID=UPI00272AF748|nr:ImmA/IrrE family metallo-endopeptidase [Ileibacterium valens]